MTARRPPMPAGSPRALLLAAASLEPLSSTDLLIRAEKYAPFQIADSSVRNICRWHAQQGHFRIAHRAKRTENYRNTPNLYVLTPLGEAKLDELHAEVNP